uniref:Myelin associated glycoprotein n=1 Tax=Anas zonorhyncha TaxID=75864 RepID=A0A8B9ZUN6_9AVES
APRGPSETPHPLLGTRGGSWAAWMPPAVAGLEGTCVVLPCRFEYPEELRPAAVHGLWYFGSPYPKSYPPVVARSRPAAVHESFAGRAELLGDTGLRDCSLRLWRLSPELAGKYYFRGDLGGYNQYSFSEHTTLEVLGELGGALRDTVGSLGSLGAVGSLGHDGVIGVPCVPGVPVCCGVPFPPNPPSPPTPVEPQVVGLWGPSEVVEGAQVELGCEAEGRPLPLLSWFRGAAVLREEPATPALRLLLPRVAPAHAGAYSCVAENRHGRHNRTLLLRVAYAPRAPVVNGTLWVVAGEPVTVTCGADSDPAPILTVLRGRRALAVAVYEARVTLELAAARPEDAGEYLCLAENQHGQRATAFNITVEYPPVVLPESRCTAGGGDGVRCVCSAAAVPEAAVVFELPSRNLTVAEGHRDFAAAPRGGPGTGGGPGGGVTGILTLRGALEPRLAVLCAARNPHGVTARQLRFHHPGQHRGLVWAKVGPVGAVVAFAIVIALVCYLSQSRQMLILGTRPLGSTPFRGHSHLGTLPYRDTPMALATPPAPPT